MQDGGRTVSEENRTVELDEEIASGVGKFIADRKDPPGGTLTFEAAINVIVRDWLQAQGYMPLPNAQGEIVRAPDAAGVPRS